MAKHIVITPCYNDWKSLNKLILALNKIKNEIKGKLEIFIINDCSTIKMKINKKVKNVGSIYFINLKKNVGSQKAIYIGLQHILKTKPNCTITVMDSDGEDDPYKVPELINISEKFKKSVVVAERSERTENIFYKFLNFLRLFLTLLMTGKYLNFGNFSCFHSSSLNKILANSNLSLAYSAGIAKNFKNLKQHPIKKKKRFFGLSKVSFGFLFEHSLNIITVYKNEVFLRSIIITFLSFFFLDSVYFLFILFVMILTNLLILKNFIYHQKLELGLKNILNVKKFK